MLVSRCIAVAVIRVRLRENRAWGRQWLSVGSVISVFFKSSCRERFGGALEETTGETVGLRRVRY
jgi:hypothetical protein